MQSMYPSNIEIDPPVRVARWRPLVNWILILPLEIWMYFLSFGQFVAVAVAWFALMFTGQMPENLGNYILGVMRYDLRVGAYLFGWAEKYPGFRVHAGYVDPGNYESILYCARPLKRRRLTVFFRGFMVFPHLIVMMILLIPLEVALFIAWFAVLIVGRWPKGLQNFSIDILRWNYRVVTYWYLLTDVYPPFGLHPGGERRD